MNEYTYMYWALLLVERESLLFSHKGLKIPPAQTKWTQIRLYGIHV